MIFMAIPVVNLADFLSGDPQLKQASTFLAHLDRIPSSGDAQQADLVGSR